MRSKPIIERIEVIEFVHALEGVGLDATGAIPTYCPGEVLRRSSGALRLYTDVGIVGEYAGWPISEAAAMRVVQGYLLGKNALERERIYKDLRLYLRQMGRLGLGIIDVALFDVAGKYYDAPIYELLGGYRKELPCYASTMNGGTRGGLSTPESFADFAEQCLEMGYPGFKIHPWPSGPISRHIDAVRAVGDRVGDRMDLMLDPFCYYETFGEALKVGRACDDAGFFWWEDPYREGGISQFGHRKLRQLVKTPLLQGEHLRSPEPHVDLILADGTDFIRGDVICDGITGTMKVARAAESLGIDIELHCCGPAQRHCMAAIRNSNYYEMVWVHPEIQANYEPPQIYACGYVDGLGAIDENGCVEVPEAPGLGVTYNWDYIMDQRTRSEEYGA